MLCIESIQTLVVPWFQRICNRASKDEDKTLPLLAQHWARISRTLQGKIGDVFKLFILIFTRLTYIFVLIVHLKEAEKEWFVDYFFALASLGSAHQPAKDKINVSWFSYSIFLSFSRSKDLRFFFS